MSDPAKPDLRITEELFEEMLAALRESENALDDYIRTLEQRGAIMGYGNIVLTQVRAVIARAIPHAR